MRTILASMLLSVAALWLLSASAAHAAVQFRSDSCAIQDLSTLTLAKPTGTTLGDLMVATLGSENGAISAPAGWTAISGLSGAMSQGQQATTWYRLAGTSEPANYTFSAPSSNALSGTISTFTDVSQTNPINAGAAQTIISTVEYTATLPNAPVATDGSMRYSAAVSDDVASTTTFESPMTTRCNVATAQSSDVALGAGYESVNAGTTPTRTVTLSDNGHMVLQTLVINPGCTGGARSVSGPATVPFPGVTLNGLDQTVASVTPLTVTDDTGTNVGWSVSATSTTFSNGSTSFPTTATQITGAAASPTAGTCSAPDNLATYPITLPAGAPAPTATKIYRANSSSGRGEHALDIAHSLTIPGSAQTGTYSSTWTWTIAAGP